MNKSKSQGWIEWWIGAAAVALVLGLSSVLSLRAGTTAVISTTTSPLPFYGSKNFTPQWLTPQEASGPAVHRVADFSLSNQLGAVVTSAQTDGKIYVASFFFSTCPGICPTLKSKLSLVQSRYLDDDDVLILSHSIRPTSDTPAILQQYATRNGIVAGKWHLLTGERSALYALAKGSYFASDDLGEEAGLQEFLHTENLLLIDRERRIRGVYNGLSRTSVEHLIDDIAVLKGER